MAKAISALLLGCLTLSQLLTPARAETYPARPIRFVVPFPAGGVADVTARVVGQKLGEALSQQVVIENRTGASGTLGADVVAKAVADGYTLLLTTGDFITTPTLMPAMSFDPYRDLVPITMIAAAPLVLGAHAGSAIRSVGDLIAAAKASPGAIAYSSPGSGTINQLAIEWLAIETGLKLLHVPYRGGVPAATAVAAGDVPIGALTPSSAMPYVDAGKVRVLALMTRQRPAFTPDWPTLAEHGIAVDAALWVGLFAPAGTDPAIIGRLDAEVSRMLQDADVLKRLHAVGTEAAPLAREKFAERIRSDAARYTRIIEQTGIRVER